MKNLSVIFIITFLFISCEMDITGLAKTPKNLLDQRFNGKFSRDMSSAMYGRGSHTYKFDGTTHAVHQRFQYYASGSNLSYLDYEIEVSNGQFRKRLWSEITSWDSWENYHFDNDGDLWIGNLEYKKE